jgi:hypothetical protein
LNVFSDGADDEPLLLLLPHAAKMSAVPMIATAAVRFFMSPPRFDLEPSHYSLS